MFSNAPIDSLRYEESFNTLKISVITSMTFLGVNYGIIFILWFFMVFDTIFGMSKVVALHGWGALNKRDFFIGIGTKMAVIFIPMSIAVTGFFAGYDLTIFVNTAMWALIANDATSCYTNILSIKKKKNYVNKDLIELLINTLRALIYNGAKSALDKLKGNDICDFNEGGPKDEKKGEVHSDPLHGRKPEANS